MERYNLGPGPTGAILTTCHLLPSPRPPTRVRFPVLFVLLLQGACAARSPRMPGPLSAVGRPTAPLTLRIDEDEPPPPPQARLRKRLGWEIAQAAKHYLTHTPRGFRADCSGFVEASLARAGVPVRGNTRSLWERAHAARTTHRRKRPAPGDLAFFDDTHDRNGNGRRDDDLTHIAVVLNVDPDGTIHLAHGGTSRGRAALTMNLLRPHERLGQDGAVLNDWLRRRAEGESKNGPSLAAELWRGFATPRPDAS